MPKYLCSLIDALYCFCCRWCIIEGLFPHKISLKFQQSLFIVINFWVSILIAVSSRIVCFLHEFINITIEKSAFLLLQSLFFTFVKKFTSLQECRYYMALYYSCFYFSIPCYAITKRILFSVSHILSSIIKITWYLKIHIRFNLT